MIFTDGVHLMTDSERDELHRFASAIGLKRCWFQRDHYDLTTPNKAEAAVREGAITLRDIGRLRIFLRIKGRASWSGALQAPRALRRHPRDGRGCAPPQRRDPQNVRAGPSHRPAGSGPPVSPPDGTVAVIDQEGTERTSAPASHGLVPRATITTMVNERNRTLTLYDTAYIALAGADTSFKEGDRCSHGACDRARPLQRPHR